MVLKIFRKWARNMIRCINTILKYESIDVLEGGRVEVNELKDIGKRNGKHYYHVNVSIEGDMTSGDLFKILWNFRRV